MMTTVGNINNVDPRSHLQALAQVLDVSLPDNGTIDNSETDNGIAVTVDDVHPNKTSPLYTDSTSGTSPDCTCLCLVSSFNGVTDVEHPVDVEIGNIVNRIRTDESLKSVVEKLRKILAENGKDEYNKRKKILPGVTFAGTFSRREKVAWKSASGLVTVDLDNLGYNLARIREQLVSDPHVFIVFTSPSGDGLKVIFRIPLSIPDLKNYLQCWHSAASYTLQLTGSKIDESGKDSSRLCFLSSDSKIHFNENAIPLTITITENGSTGSMKVPRASGIGRNKLQGSSESDLHSVIKSEAEAVRGTIHGGRNDRLNKAAFLIGKLLSGNERHFDMAQKTLLKAGFDCGLSEDEANPVIYRGLEDGIAKSRDTAPISETTGNDLQAEPIIPFPVDALLSGVN